MSQKVRVKSNGECWIEQKLSRPARTAASSSGTIVKLTAFFSSIIRGV